MPLRALCILAAFFLLTTTVSASPPANIVAAAEAGDTAAQIKLGRMLLNGDGVDKDPAKARAWFQEAAQTENAEAQMLMGYTAHNGLGTPKDIKAAVIWYEKAAAQGHHAAEFNLGLIYEAGEGVPQDILLAKLLFIRASEHKTYNLPQFRVGRIYETGLAGPIDIKKAKDWYYKAAFRGLPEAQYALARLMETDARDVEGLKLVLHWYKLAADGGIDDADTAAARVEAKLVGLQKAATKVVEAARSETPNRAGRLPPSGPIVEYKGRKLVGSTYKNAANDEFFKWMKWALDKVDALPAHLKGGASHIREFRYDPPSPERAQNDVYTNIVGVYTIDEQDTFPAPIVIYQDMRWGAPISLAYNIATSGIYADRHRKRIEVAKKLARHETGERPLSPGELKSANRAFYELSADLHKTDQRVLDEYACEPILRSFALTEVWETDSRKRDAIARDLALRNCH